MRLTRMPKCGLHTALGRKCAVDDGDEDSAGARSVALATSAPAAHALQEQVSTRDRGRTSPGDDIVATSRLCVCACMIHSVSTCIAPADQHRNLALLNTHKFSDIPTSAMLTETARARAYTSPILIPTTCSSLACFAAIGSRCLLVKLKLV